VRWPIIILFAASTAWAQAGGGNPVVASSEGFYTMVKQNIMRTAEKVPADKYAFRPTDSVRTIGQLLAHVADGQYEFCGAAVGDHERKNFEETAKTKAEIQSALKTAFSYCDAIYAKMTDAKALELMPGFGGQKITRLSMLDFNVAHTNEHYGNLVTYMRIEGIVPPSSSRNGQ